MTRYRWLPWVPFLVTLLGIGIHYGQWSLAVHQRDQQIRPLENEVTALKAKAGPVLLLEKQQREAQPFLDIVHAFETPTDPPLSYAEWSSHIPSAMRPADVTRTSNITVVEGRLTDGLERLVASVGETGGYATPEIEKTEQRFYLTLSAASRQEVGE